MSTGVFFQENIVPRRALKVFSQPVHRERACCRRCTVMFPFPPCPLAGQASLGQNTWVGSIAFLLGGQEIRICYGPRQFCSTFSPCHGFADTYLSNLATRKKITTIFTNIEEIKLPQKSNPVSHVKSSPYCGKSGIIHVLATNQ